MINMKKAFLTAAVLSALCASAFASDNMAQNKPAPAEGKRPAICDQRGGMHHKKFEKMTPEQREQLHKDNMAKREAWKNMTPEQREAVRVARPGFKKGFHHPGPKGHGPQMGHGPKAEHKGPRC